MSGMSVSFCKLDAVEERDISIVFSLEKSFSAFDGADVVVIFLKTSSFSKRGIARAISFSLTEILKFLRQNVGDNVCWEVTL